MLTSSASHDSSDENDDTTASAHAVASAPVASSTTTIKETDETFATRVLAEYPGLKPADFTNVHYTVIFGTPSKKSMSKLVAARAKLQAGLTTN